MAFHVQRLENHRRTRDGLRHPQCSLRTNPDNESISKPFDHSQPDTESSILVLDQPPTLRH